mgnify:CR=1 FL=1
MSGQASNLTFSDSAIQRAVIERVFDERKKYLIIALTGKIGAGSSYVSSFIQKASNGEEIPCSSSECNNYSSDEERADNILLRYFECNRIPFHVIRVRDVITSFIVENDAWARLAIRQQNIKKAESDIMRLLHGKLKRLLYNIVLQPGGGDAFIDGKKVGRNEAETLNSSVRRMLSGWDKKRSPKLLTEYNRYLKKSNLEIGKEIEIRNYILYILPLLSDSIREYLAEKYTVLFQEFGNDLRFYGTLKTDKGARAKSAVYEDNKDRLYAIAERINRMIKHIRAGAGDNARTAIVIDSMKNKYESNYLRDRYSAYYLFAVSRDETIRIHHLLQDQKKGLSQDEIEKIDLNERPDAVAGRFVRFADILKNIDWKEVRSEINANLSEEFDTQEFGNYLSSLCSNSCEEFYRMYCKPFKSQTCMTDEKQKMLRILGNSNVISAIRNIVFEADEQMASRFREQGISSAFCDYYLNVLADPLRTFLYKTKLYPFFLQDVEYCIQNADVFLTNNEPDSGPKHQLKMNVIRYISLMMHPGLVPPTPVERCMQLAYTAKVNSGCISRQTGAVVTDSEYNIISLGWNDVPYGQTPCVYRNLLDLQRQNDKRAFSDYEWESNSPFQNNLQKYDFSMAASLNGLPASFCFKTLNEKVTGEKNPMSARAMHGEEKALLQGRTPKIKGGCLFTTSSPCEMCAKNAKEHQISKIYYIEPYPGISQRHVCNSGDSTNRAQYILFEGAIGRAYTQLYTPILPYKDELSLRGFPHKCERKLTRQPQAEKSDEKN